MTREEQATRILRRYDRIIAELEQVIRDVTWWNQNRTDAQPFDFGAELVVLRMKREERAAFVAQLENDTPETRERVRQLSDKCLRFMEQHFTSKGSDDAE